MPKRLLTIALMAGLLFGAGIVKADTPALVTVQGKLTDSAGAPLPPGQRTLIFKLFDSPISTREIWPQQGAGDEAHVVTTGADGIWTVKLGETYPLTDVSFSNSSRWLEIQVDDGVNPIVALPRLEITTNPFTHRISTVDGATGGDIYGDTYLHSDLWVGELGDEGNVIVRDNTTFPTVKLDGQGGQVEAFTSVRLVENIDGDMFAELGKNGSGGGVLRTRDELNNQTCILGSPGSGGGGFLNLHLDASIWPGAVLDGDDAGAGRLLLNKEVLPSSFVNTVSLDADGGDGGALFQLGDGSQVTVHIDGKGGEGGGGFLMYNNEGANTIELDGDEGGVGVFRLLNSTGSTRLRAHATGFQGGGELLLLDTDGTTTVELRAAESATNGAQLQLRKADGTATITLDAEQGEGGTGRIITPVLQITGGADISEQFDIHASEGVEPLPGMVVCLDPAHPGELIVSSRAHDRTVAGVVSGAGGVSTGLLMQHLGTAADGVHPVALTGRVYVMADASSGPIDVGDLLTTSDVPGHAMRVSDHTAAQGAILGKAMSPLPLGRGLVLALVTLQ